MDRSVDAMNVVFFANKAVRLLSDYVDRRAETSDVERICAEMSALFRSLGEQRELELKSNSVRGLVGSAKSAALILEPISTQEPDGLQQVLDDLTEKAERIARTPQPTNESRDDAQALILLFDKVGNRAATDLVPSF